MSADLSQVLPGWRGTDPDGGTWVLTAADDPAWAEITSEGLWAWRSQEEAEAAGLEPLYMVQLPDPLPAPLDPGNPEHLRQVVKFVMSCYIGEDDDVIAEQVRALATSLHSRADRLDRERAEAERDAKAREVATEIARGCWPFDSFDNAVAALTQAVRVDPSKEGEK